MPDVSTLTFKDFNEETATTSVKVADITAVNFDGTETSLVSYRTAIQKLTLTFPSRQRLSTKLYQDLVITNDPLAQVENKWLVKVADPAGNIRPYTEIPTADLTLLEDGSEYIIRNGNVTVSDPNSYIADFKTAFEAIAVNDAGESLVLYEIQFVGRNR